MPTKHLLHVNGSVHAVEAEPERPSLAFCATIWN